MISLKTQISSYAFKTAKHKSFKDEHWLAIVFAWLIRFTTAGVSIYSGWFFFVNYMKGMSQTDSNAPYVFSILLLILVEFLAAYAITKAAKAILHKQLSTSIISGVFAVGIFGLSFYSSTNGLAARQSKKADNTEIIVANSDIQRVWTNNNYDNQIRELRAANDLELENLQGWRNGQRSVLSEAQMKRIEENNKQIGKLNDLKRSELAQLKNERKAELKENRDIMMAEADKYWLFIAIVLGISALSNISLQAFSHVILKQEARELYLEGHTKMRKARMANILLRDTLRSLDEQTSNIVKELELTSVLADAPTLNYNELYLKEEGKTDVKKDERSKDLTDDEPPQRGFLNAVNSVVDFAKDLTGKKMFNPVQLNFDGINPEKKKPITS